jgi:hypothetical protein
MAFRRVRRLVAALAAGALLTSGLLTISATSATAGSYARSTAAPATTGEIKIGIQYVANGADSARAAGAQVAEGGGLEGDLPRAEWNALIDDVNDNGGVLGKKVVPVFFAIDGLQGQSTAVVEQAACTRFTQDNKVFVAYIASYLHTESLVRCLADAGVLVLTQSGSIIEDAKQIKGFDKLFATTGSINLTRFIPAYVDGLAKQGYFEKDSKVGILSLDLPSFDRAAALLEKELKKRKINLAEHVVVPYFQDNAGAATAAAQIAGSVLKFKAAEVDRLLLLSFQGVGFLFMAQAEPQGFRPVYGLSSIDGAQSLAVALGDNATKQLEGAKGIGWSPPLDVEAATPNAAAAKCDALMQANGLPSGFSVWATCDSFNVFVEAAKAGGKVTAKSVIAGFHKMGVLHPANVLTLEYQRGAVDGISTYRPLAYSADCTCFEYTDKEIAIS